MQILVTGGVGYIGSHTCVALFEAGHTIIIADNLCNSKVETIDKIKEIIGKEVIFYQIDVTDEAVVDTTFAHHNIDSIIHFAGLKTVGESVEKTPDLKELHTDGVYGNEDNHKKFKELGITHI